MSHNRSTCLAALSCGLILAGCADGRSGNPSGYGGPPQVGDVAPNFTLARIHKGETLELAQVVKGNKLTLVNFWATWCGPCLIELPELEKLQQKYRHDGFQVLAINLDSSFNPVDRYLSENHFSFPMLYDASQRVQERYGVYGLPSNFYLDSKGEVLSVVRGYNPYMETQLVRLLNSQKSE